MNTHFLTLLASITVGLALAAPTKAADIKIYTTEAPKGITLERRAHSISAIHSSELAIVDALPKNAAELGKNFWLSAQHTCESANAIPDLRDPKARKNIAVRLDPQRHTEGNDFSKIIIDENFKPLPGSCRIKAKVTYRNADKKRIALYEKVIQLSVDPKSADVCHARGIHSVDLNNDGRITPDDINPVSRYLGSRHVLGDVNENGMVTDVDLGEVMQRIQCKNIPVKCTPTLFNRIDITNDGLINNADFDVIFTAFKNQNSGIDARGDINEDGALTREDLEIADYVARFCQF